MFLETGYNDSLQQCIKSSSCKTHEKTVLGLTFEPNEPKLGFSPFSQVCFISLPLNCIE